MVDLVAIDDEFAMGFIGGPRYSTNIVVVAGGFERRNAVWARPRYAYQWDTAPRPISEVQDIVKFFHGREGRQRAFLLLDPGDSKSCAQDLTPSMLDQELSLVSGQTAQYQLVKLYNDTANPYSRNITHPKSGTVKVALDGVELSLGSEFSVSTSTGIVTLLSSPTPSGDVTAGFEFYTPVRFDTDEIQVQVQLSAFQDPSGDGLAVIRGLTAIEVRV